MGKLSSQEQAWLRSKGHKAAKLDKVKNKERVAAICELHGVDIAVYRRAAGIPAPEGGG